MEELIQEVKRIIQNYKSNVDRNKKYFNYPFTDNTSHYHRLMMLQAGLEVWQQCCELIVRFQKNRWGPIESPRSIEFTKRIEVELVTPGFITISTRNAMITYMKRLECRVEEVEVILSSSIMPNYPRTVGEEDNLIG